MTRTNLTFPTGLVLQAIAGGIRYGFDIIEATGLPSGTVYPALRRLEGAGFLCSRWEAEQEAAGRPARCYYALTSTGATLLEQAVERFPAILLTLGKSGRSRGEGRGHESGAADTGSNGVVPPEPEPA